MMVNTIQASVKTVFAAALYIKNKKQGYILLRMKG